MKSMARMTPSALATRAFSNHAKRSKASAKPPPPTGVLAHLEHPAEPGFAGRGEQFDGKLADLVEKNDRFTATTEQLEPSTFPLVEKRVDASGQTATKFRRFAEDFEQLRSYLRTVEARREIGRASGSTESFRPSRDSRIAA